MRLKHTTVIHSAIILSGIVIFFLIQPTFAATDPWKPIPIRPENTRPATVHLWTTTFSDNGSFPAFDATNMSGGNIASGDLLGDGHREIVVGAGAGYDAMVKIFSMDGKVLGSFNAYQNGFRGGVRVAVADLNGDGKVEIVTAPGPGIPSTINTYSFDGTHAKLINSTTAYSKSFIGGIHIVAGDFFRDGKAEIVTAPGPGGGPDIRVFDGQLRNLGNDFFAFDASMTDGVTLSLIHTPDGSNLVAAPESWSMPIVKRFRLHPDAQLVGQFLAFDGQNRNGVVSAGVDVDGDGNDEIVVTHNGDEHPDLSVFDIYGTKIGTYSVLDQAYRGSVSMTSTKTTDGKSVLAVIPNAPVVTGPTTSDKDIDVNITEQRLYAYEHGRLASSFLVSTGISRHPTPIITTTVMKKIPIMDYKWYYGPGNPDNYNLPNVKYNLNIWDHIYIHSAYWHHNFGHEMSHGCVNTSLKDAAWIYDWADVGTPVQTHV